MARVILGDRVVVIPTSELRELDAEAKRTETTREAVAEKRYAVAETKHDEPEAAEEPADEPATEADNPRRRHRR